MKEHMGGRIMGIDYGTQKIGIALSDEEGQMAFPEAVIPAGAGAVSAIRNLCGERGVLAIVFGESRTAAGEKNLVMRKSERFRTALEKHIDIPIYNEPELFSTMHARAIQGLSAHTDASAAAIILQRFLDRRRRANTPSS